MLRRSDAAFLPNGMPGRGYLQVGNENIELIQVAYTGENLPLRRVLRGRRQPKFYDVIVELCNDLLASRRAARARPGRRSCRPRMTFATPLRERYLDPAYEPLITLGRSVAPDAQPVPAAVARWQGRLARRGLGQAAPCARIAGLLDDPYNARQLPLVVDLSKGHAVLFGASGWGKTTLLRTLMLSLAATHSPDEFHAHVLDLGGRNLEVLRALPHVGTVIMPDERGYEERVQQLLRELNDSWTRASGCSARPASRRCSSITMGHRRRSSRRSWCWWTTSASSSRPSATPTQADDENSLLAAFIALARQANAYGLHVVITASRLNVLTSKLYSLFTERFTLRLSDADDYCGHRRLRHCRDRGDCRAAATRQSSGRRSASRWRCCPARSTSRATCAARRSRFARLGEQMHAAIASQRPALPAAAAHRRAAQELVLPPGAGRGAARSARSRPLSRGAGAGHARSVGAQQLGRTRRLAAGHPGHQPRASASARCSWRPRRTACTA